MAYRGNNVPRCYGCGCVVGPGDAICCDGVCHRIFHYACVNFTMEQWTTLKKSKTQWLCDDCSLLVSPKRRTTELQTASKTGKTEDRPAPSQGTVEKQQGAESDEETDSSMTDDYTILLKPDIEPVPSTSRDHSFL